MGINYGKRYKDYAIFCPAITDMYIRMLERGYGPRDWPSTITSDDMNFLNPSSNLIHVPYSLYSAGQACKRQRRTIPNDMITNRDRQNTILIGDSGGFQVMTDTIKYKGDETNETMLRWLEQNTDYSMILDFPTGGINMGNITKHTIRLNKELKNTAYHYVHNGKTYVLNSVEDFCHLIGYHTPDDQQLGFATCLLQTVMNNEYFVKHAVPGKTTFMNVMQGRTLEESNIWYDHVKKFDFGAWSFSCSHKENFSITMHRLIEMWDDGLLKDRNWIHFLGVGKLQHGCVYTTIQRQIREHINPNLTISYDASSPFTSVAFGTIMLGCTLSQNGWRFQTGSFDGVKYMAGQPEGNRMVSDVLREQFEAKGVVEFEKGGNSHFIETEIIKKLKASDVCLKINKKGTTTWDTMSYVMMMNHNLQTHLECVFNAQDYYDANDVTHVPYGLLKIRDLIPKIFQHYKEHGKQKTLDFIYNHASDLNFLSNGKGGVIDFSQFDVPLAKVPKKAIKPKLGEISTELFDGIE